MTTTCYFVIFQTFPRRVRVAHNSEFCSSSGYLLGPDKGKILDFYIAKSGQFHFYSDVTKTIRKKSDLGPKPNFFQTILAPWSGSGPISEIQTLSGPLLTQPKLFQTELILGSFELFFIQKQLFWGECYHILIDYFTPSTN